MMNKIVFAMPAEEYHAAPGVSRSLLQAYLKSCKAGLHAETCEREDTLAMLRGRAVHTLALDGPDAFHAHYAVGGPINAKTGKSYGMNTKAFAEWEAEQGKPVLSEDEAALAAQIVEAINNHGEARTLLRGQACELDRNEASAFAPFGDTLCKCRPDMVRLPILADLKTTRCDLDDHSLQQEIYGRGYHQQAAWYIDVYRAAAGYDKHMGFQFLFVQNVPPHDVRVVELEEEAVELGRADMREALTRYETCHATGVWPGVSDTVDVLGLPHYAYPDDLQLESGAF